MILPYIYTSVIENFNNKLFIVITTNKICFGGDALDNILVNET